MRMGFLAALVAAGTLAPWPGVAVASAQAACADLGGAVDATGVCRVHDTNPAYTLDFSFPDDYPDQQALIGYLTQTRDGFVNVSDMPGAWNLPYVLDANGTGYRSGTPTRGTRSVVFEVYQNVGGAHPQTWYKAFNHDLATGAPITFDTLFRPGTDALDVIFPIVQSELQKQTGIANPLAPGDGTDPAHYQNFAVTDDAVIFFFGQGEVLPSAAGATQASVPRAALAPLLAL
ncbi:MAG: DUF3298 domain-containing protein [Actinobacteria bacterium]|nr:DUF3298 domain-containing protein [Actinomycetota bacterium]